MHASHSVGARARILITTMGVLPSQVFESYRVQQTFTQVKPKRILQEALTKEDRDFRLSPSDFYFTRSFHSQVKMLSNQGDFSFVKVYLP